MTVTVFWGVTPCSLEDRYQRFGKPTFSIFGVDPKLILIIKIIIFKENEKNLSEVRMTCAQRRLYVLIYIAFYLSFRV